MQELERMIKIYHIAFIVFLILTIVFLLLSVILFFRFNIRGIFDMRTGRGAKRTIQKMQELNDQTGKLREDVVNYTASRLASEDRIQLPPITQKETKPLARPGSYGDGSQETTLLHGGDGSQETTLLYGGDNSQETTVLSQNQNIQQPVKLDLPGAFKIEKELMWINTKEIL